MFKNTLKKVKSRTYMKSVKEMCGRRYHNSRAKINQFDSQKRIHDQIFVFDIPMNNATIVQIYDCIQNLTENVLGKWLIKL